MAEGREGRARRARASFLRLPLSRTSTTRPHRPQEIFMLDVIYIVIGTVAFVVTVFYLPACDKL